MIAIRAASEEPWLDPGSAAIRNFCDEFLRTGARNQQVHEDLSTHVEEWLVQQRLLQSKANEILASLMLMADDDVEKCMDWYTQPWAMKIRFPWSDSLAKSIADATQWIEAHG